MLHEPLNLVSSASFLMKSDRLEKEADQEVNIKE